MSVSFSFSLYNIIKNTLLMKVTPKTSVLLHPLDVPAGDEIHPELTDRGNEVVENPNKNSDHVEMT
jgi:aspartate carbamoyltransferase catalytic subunit